ncbi:nuclear transport factor 2 family protein [Rhodococcus fascians]|nr:nuclear transport factor 2 family protein [Rhodococcus fascians]MBY4237832.1 nuclear transport factor 2 family protein [Rhodococcus fascians]MBY4253417.1 nuclear transport factor 2 family protein [Rhodococcus fascians]MBY4269054.1 nuclear transport factor 2 family protein [Rhodococcus fascians]MBY4275107.1 nuclear transport factor 2 family protein [Rhodococcus fascians]
MSTMNNPEQLADRQSVADLCSRYALALDRNDWQALTEIFDTDGVMDFAHVGEVSGPAAIAEICSQALTSLDGSQHLVGTILVTVDGDRASSISYFHAQHVKAGEIYTVGGQYVDRARRTSGGWKLAHRVQTVTWTSGDEKVLSA